ncbi:CPBP family intramembrane glutamic endopeptidase [Brevundimonas sp.]
MTGLELYAPRAPRHRRTWTLAAIGLALVFIIGGQLLGIIPALMTGFIGPDGATDRWDQLAYILFATFGCGAVLVFLWIRFFERRPLTTIGFNADGLKRFGRGYAIGLAFLLAAVGIIWALGGYSVEAGGAFQSAAVGAALVPIVVLLLGFIVQGSTEEIFFRGWLMQLIASRHGLWLAVGINSLLFGVMHGANIPPSKELFMGLLNIVLFGVFISLYAAREGSLWGVKAGMRRGTGCWGWASGWKCQGRSWMRRR